MGKRNQSGQRTCCEGKRSEKHDEVSGTAYQGRRETGKKQGKNQKQSRDPIS